jgi:hypothetical protein
MQKTQLIAAAALTFAAALPQSAALAQEQEQLTVCTTQQDLEQVLASDGSIVPDNCRTLAISSLESDGRELCLLSFGEAEGGVLETLRDVAGTSEWWVACDALRADIP